ncbi:MAG: aspartate/glutamate racemase family protein [Anaerolineales bacterium]|nr:aspartate/glutamate racemase family protein [Anaerolineales bacterium]
MARTLVFVHTVPSLVDLFTRLSRELLPNDVEIWHIADEILLKVVLAQGGLSAFIHQRVAEHAVSAEHAGAAVVQLTCSSISPCAETARSRVRIPVLTVDEPMVDRALELGARIGVAATAPTTLRPTSDLLRARAQAAGKDVQIEARLAEGAYAALFGGDPSRHDAIVRQTIEDLLQRNDVVVLAQASMARVVEALPPETLACPILTSPRLALEHAARVLREPPA